jgi:hypothetical protein
VAAPESRRELSATNSRWPRRAVFGAFGALAAGAPLISATCSGGCAGCLRCLIGAGAIVSLLVGGSLARRIGSNGANPISSGD